MNNHLTRVLVGLLFIFTLFSCQDDPKLPNNLVEFEAEVAGIAVEEVSLPININLSRAASTDVTVTVALAASGLQYGTDFTTTPEAIENTISVTIPAGETQGSITLTKTEGVGFTGDESVVFTINEVVDGSPIIGTIPQITVSFSEITVNGAIANIQGGGPTFPNRVFIDLSANRQTAVSRTSWDFGFYTEADQSRVILNSSLSMLARPTDKNDMTAVTSADTVGVGHTFTIDNTGTSDNLPFLDDPTGDITNTAFAEVSWTNSDNKVYIVNRGKDVSGTPRSWKKVRVLKNETGYTIQYADINSSTFETIEVTTDASTLFNYVSVDQNQVVTVEPEKTKWDIAYTPFLNTFYNPDIPGYIPYMFNDVIIQNRSGVETAQLLIADVGEYADFDASDLSTVVYGTTQLNIGSKWRTIGGGPGSPPTALKTDRFYIIKDADGNIYKLRFTALTQEGLRGTPQIEYELL